MRLALATRGMAFEGSAVDEFGVRALARALAALGHEVLLLSATARAPAEEPQRDGPLRLRWIVRDDLHPDHWHKSLSPAAARAFRTLLREERVEVVHIHHWQRLSRDLVLSAAREGVPAVVTLHDSWVACPLGTRLRSDSGAHCDEPVGPQPCIACAGRVLPRTPWVPLEQAFMLLAERQRDLLRELALARAVVVPTRERQLELERWLATRLEATLLDAASPAWAAAHEALYQRASAEGPPAVAAEEWFEERMRSAALSAWDARCRGG